MQVFASTPVVINFEVVAIENAIKEIEKLKLYNINDKKYIVRELLSDFSAMDNLKNKKALIAFRSANTAKKEDAFIIPIRWGTIKEVNEITNGYTVDFVIDGYPNYTQEFRNACSNFATINDVAVKCLYSADDRNDFAVWNGTLESVTSNGDNPADRDNELWTQIVSAITKIPRYSQMLFIRCSNFYTEYIDESNNIINNNCNKAGRFYELIEGKCSYVDIEYYSSSYDKSISREIKAYIDENKISKAKGLRTIIESRYGKITLGFQPHKVPNHTVSEIVISSMSDKKDELSTDITYPIIINKDRKYKFVKSFIMVIGAIMVAMPGVLGDSISVLWNIGLASAGAIILGVNTYWESKE